MAIARIQSAEFRGDVLRHINLLQDVDIVISMEGGMSDGGLVWLVFVSGQLSIHPRMGEHRPARAVVPTGELHYGLLIEIEAIAAVNA